MKKEIDPILVTITAGVIGILCMATFIILKLNQTGIDNLASINLIKLALLNY